MKDINPPLVSFFAGTRATVDQCATPAVIVSLSFQSAVSLFVRNFDPFEGFLFFTGRLKFRYLIGRANAMSFKAAVAFYYLKEMPYPTSYDLLDALREETPSNLQYLIKDLFEEITLFSNRTLEADAVKRAGGNYDITLQVEARKFKADSKETKPMRILR